MIAYMIKIDILAGRWLWHSLDREHLHDGSCFIEKCVIRQLTNNFKKIWFSICGLILGTKSPSCYILDQFGCTKLFVLFNLDEIYCLKKRQGQTKWVGPLGAVARKGRTGTDNCLFGDPNE